MIKLALDGMISFSSFPLKIATYFGFLVAGASFLYIIYALFLKFLTNKPVPGWTSAIVAIMFLGGVQLICLGIIGEYVGRINEETKSRPLYIIRGVLDPSTTH
jgi:dolichol-phosphate mannosyltransferase